MHGIILPVFGLPVHTAVMIYIIIGLAIFAAIAGKRFTLVPGRMQSLLELVASGFLNMVDENMGHKGRKYFPFILTLAVFIFISNALGLVPGLLPPTANLNCTLGLALVVFFMTHIIGVKEHGLKYFKHFEAWSGGSPLMIPIEIISTCTAALFLEALRQHDGHEQIVMVL